MFTRIFPLLLLILISFGSFGQGIEIVQTSPRNHSIYHQPATSITLRAAKPWRAADKAELNIDITGQQSGPHSYRLVTTLDEHVLVLNPDEDFEPGEVVLLEVRLGTELLLELDFQITANPGLVPVGEFDEPEVKEEVAAKNGGTLPNHEISVNNNPSPLPIFFHNNGDPNDKYHGIFNTIGLAYCLIQGNNFGNHFKLQASGYLTAFQTGDRYWYLMDSLFNHIDTLVCGNGYECDVHECLHYPGGNHWLMAYDDQIIDMSQVVSGGATNATVTGLIIQELDANHNVLWQWRSWDHFNLLDAEGLNMTSNSIDIVHGNSIDTDANGNVLISSRSLNEMTLIDKTTGNILWRMGGLNNQFTFVNDTLGFNRQHDGRILPNGNMTMMDNGVSHVPGRTAAKEYAIDTVNMTATLVWEFPHPTGFVAQRMGNVQRLANGNTFINWGFRGNDANNPNYTEVDPQGNITWQFRFIDDASYTSYRATRAEWDTTFLNITPNRTEFRLRPYPNPAQSEISLKLEQDGQVEVTLLDYSGRILIQELKTGPIVRLQVGDLPAGAYLLRVEENAKSWYGRVVVTD